MLSPNSKKIKNLIKPYSFFFFSSHLPLSFFPSYAFNSSVLSVNATMETSCVAKGIAGGGRARTRGKIKMEVCGVNNGVWGGDYIARWSRETARLEITFS